jgi:DHA2 family multidrug resistance protein
MAPHRGRIMTCLMVATTMQSLDTTIANIALPHIQGSLAATQEQMSWVITSYIVAAAVMTPLSAWIASRIGRKKFFLISIAAFTFSSTLCGMAQTLPQIVFFRLLQGLSGAAISPLSQAILLDINPPERHARAMAVWMTGVTIGPIFGAPLGAWITDYLNWRWVFYINVPAGLLCMLGLMGSLPETPPMRRSFDFFGFFTLSIATLSLQLMLDRGQLKDWFNAPEIWVEITCTALGIYLFAVHTATVRESFINMRLFRDRNFSVGCALGVVITFLMLGPLVLTTSLLQGLLQYPVMTAGFVATSRAIGMVTASSLLGRMLRYMDTRFVIALGFAIAAIALGQMCRFHLQMHYSLVFWSGVIFGAGVGLASVSIATVAFATLPVHLRTEGAAVSGLVRNLGGSIGIAVTQTLLIRSTSVMQSRLAEHITPYKALLFGQPDLSNTAGLIAINGRVVAQATMLAYNNIFKLLLVIAVISMPLAFLFRKAAPQKVVAVIE